MCKVSDADSAFGVGEPWKHLVFIEVRGRVKFPTLGLGEPWKHRVFIEVRGGV